MTTASPVLYSRRNHPWRSSPPHLAHIHYHVPDNGNGFHSDLCDVCAHPGGVGLFVEALFCPCCVLRENLKYLERIDPSSAATHSSCDADGHCFGYGSFELLQTAVWAVTAFFVQPVGVGFAVNIASIFHCSARDRVLKLYGITHRSSECQNTCLETYFCAPCALAQERREIVIREGEYNSEGREIWSAEVEVPTQAPQAQEMSPDYQRPVQSYPRSWPRADPPRTIDDLRRGDSIPVPQQEMDTTWIIDAWRFLRSIPRQVRGAEPEPGSPRTQNDNHSNSNDRDNPNNNRDNASVVEPEPPSEEFKKVVQKLKRAHAKGADLPPEFISSISLEVLEEPVCTIDGQTYDREHISKWFRSKGPGNITSPLTGKRLSSPVLIPNHTLRANMMTWMEQNRTD